jgi:hypothetical protein
MTRPAAASNRAAVPRHGAGNLTPRRERIPHPTITPMSIGQKNEAAHAPGGDGPPRALATRSQGIHSRCSPSCRHRLDCSARGRAHRSSGFHPQAAWPDRKVRQCGRCESVGSRTDFSHCTPRRHIGVDEARDWPRLLWRGDHPDRRTPEPLICVGALPGIPSESRSHEAWPRLMGSQPFPRATEPKLRSPRNHASAEFSSAYDDGCARSCGSTRPTEWPRSAYFHFMWMCAEVTATCTPHRAERNAEANRTQSRDVQVESPASDGRPVHEDVASDCPAGA